MAYNPLKMLKKALNSKKLLVKIAAAALVFYLFSLFLSFTGIEGFREGMAGGNKKIIYFHMKGCPHCEKFKPEWDKFAAKPPDGIKVEEPIEAKEMTAEHKKLGVSGFPSVILVDGSGKRLASLDEKEKELKDAGVDSRTQAGLNKFVEIDWTKIKG